MRARLQPAAAPAIHELLSYRLGVISGLLSRSAALRYRREFGVSLWEWRAIALLGARSPMSLNELAKGAGLDKSQMSRVASSLVLRGLLLRGADANDGRGVSLVLSREGRRTCTALMRCAGERDELLRACVPAGERGKLERLLTLLHEQARELYTRERAIAAGTKGKRARASAMKG